METVADPGHGSAGAEAPVVSVVVSTYNRSDRLPRLIGALESQRLDDPFEVVIVDDGSTDDTWDLLSQLSERVTSRLRPLRMDVNGGASRGRNAGWRAATAPLVVFTDDDCRPDPGWLAAMSAALVAADIVQGRTVPDPEHEHLRGPFSHTMELTEERGWYETCNIGYRRTILEGIGGFDEIWRRSGEDTDLAWRAIENGARTRFADDAVVYHEVTASDYGAHLRDSLRWYEAPLVVKRHPHLRTELYHSRWFWRSSHPKALEALAAIAVAVSPAPSVRGRVARVAVAAMLAHPYWHFRTEIEPLRAGPRRRRALIPLVFLSDLVEVGVLARASVRYRTLFL